MRSIDGTTERADSVLSEGSGPQTLRPAHGDGTAEEAARKAIQDGIPPFPEREGVLSRAFGLEAGAVLNQLVFWAGKGHGIDGDTGWVYKTLSEWRRERGLTRKQVDRARARLKDAGVLEERHHRGNRVFYRIRWARLATELRAKGELPRCEDDAASPTTKTGLPPGGRSGLPNGGHPGLPPGGHSGLHPGGHSLTESTQVITETTVKEGGSGGEEDAVLSGGAHERPWPSAEASGPSFCPEGGVASFAEERERPPEEPAERGELSSAEVSRVCNLLWKGRTIPGRLALAHLRHKQTGDGAAVTVEQVAAAVCRELNEGSDEAADRYVAPVRDALRELHRDLLLSEVPQ